MPASEARTLEHDQELAGLDLLELAGDAGESRRGRIWRATWPKVVAAVFGIAIWQLVVWSGWKPEFALAPPREAWDDLWGYAADGTLTTALGITMRRALTGFALAIVIGTVVGSLVARIPTLRAAVGSLITGLQTMPSIAWFPLAILIFQLSERQSCSSSCWGRRPRSPTASSRAPTTSPRSCCARVACSAPGA